MGTKTVYLNCPLFSTNVSGSLSSSSTAILIFLSMTDRASNRRWTKKKYKKKMFRRIKAQAITMKRMRRKESDKGSQILREKS